MKAMILSVLMILSFKTAYAKSIESFELREKGFLKWTAQREKEQLLRQSFAEKQREARLQVQLKKIRERLKFKRVYRSTAPLEEAYIKAHVGDEEKKQKLREAYARRHRLILDYYEKHMLPLKAKEYGLEKIEVVEQEQKVEDHE